jgi:hypothetical protein
MGMWWLQPEHADNPNILQQYSHVVSDHKSSILCSFVEDKIVAEKLVTAQPEINLPFISLKIHTTTNYFKMKDTDRNKI